MDVKDDVNERRDSQKSYSVEIPIQARYKPNPGCNVGGLGLIPFLRLFVLRRERRGEYQQLHLQKKESTVLTLLLFVYEVERQLRREKLQSVFYPLTVTSVLILFSRLLQACASPEVMSSQSATTTIVRQADTRTVDPTFEPLELAGRAINDGIRKDDRFPELDQLVQRITIVLLDVMLMSRGRK